MLIETWFPVAVAYHDLDQRDQESIERKVDAWLLVNSGSLDVGDEETMKTSYHRSRDFIQDAGLDELERVVWATANEYMRTVGGCLPEGLRLESWVNVFEHGSCEARHAHYAASVSGCYYVKAPANSGAFRIHDPIDARQMWGHQVGLEANSNDLSLTSVVYKPAPGRLLVFQSWMPHSVDRQAPLDPRVSIAFNLTT
jgi:uncharacterized protein (TIGR02466 family)